MPQWFYTESEQHSQISLRARIGQEVRNALIYTSSVCREPKSLIERTQSLLAVALANVVTIGYTDTVMAETIQIIKSYSHHHIMPTN